MKNLFEYEDYRIFLADHLASSGKGSKLRLAEIIECQPGYVSQILNGSANLSAEQAEKFCAFLGWAGAETQYFLNLLNLARAGTSGLRAHLTSEVKRMRSEALVLKNRLKPEKVLSLEHQAKFYSSWHFGALHVSVSIPGGDSEEGLAQIFDLPLKRVHEIVQFLLQVGLLERLKESGRLQIGSSQVFVGTDSPLISKHHTNWRLRAIEAQDRYREQHLHYSSVVSIAESDVLRVREIMTEAIQTIRAVVRASKDERCFSYAMDLFEVGGP